MKYCFQYPLINYLENVQVYTHLLNHSGEKCPHLKLQYCFHLNESVFMLVVQTGKDRSIKYQEGDSISVMNIKKPVIVSKVTIIQVGLRIISWLAGLVFAIQKGSVKHK